jgi:hypothetical protein
VTRTAGSKSLSTTSSPFYGCSLRKSDGACTYSGATQNVKHRRMSASVALASSITKSCPMHDRGPREKDSSAFGCDVAMPMSSRNQSGLNAPASAPHTSSSRWSITIGISKRVPLGTFTPQRSAPAVARLAINGTTPYSRSVSYSTMVSRIRCRHGGGRWPFTVGGSALAACARPPAWTQASTRRPAPRSGGFGRGKGEER